MLTVDVDLVEPLGSDTLVYGHIGENRTGARIAVRLHESFDARTGQLGGDDNTVFVQGTVAIGVHKHALQ